MKGNYHNMLIISGPTGMKKSDYAIFIHQFLKKNMGKESEIINFDSLLFYRGLDIGTAKPSPQELTVAPHHLIDINHINEPLDASDFINAARPIINRLLEDKKIPILVGGSAFYLRALIKGMHSTVTIDEKIKKHTETIYEKEGIRPIRQFLKENDPASFEQLHENDHYRLIRAFEFFQATGTPFSEQKSSLEQKDPYDFSTPEQGHWCPAHLYLNMAKTEHYPIIEKRAKKMLEAGLIDEVKQILSNGYSGYEKPLQSIGYKEVLSYLNGHIKTQEELLEKIFIATRQLAKAQRTFFNKIAPKEEYHPLKDEKKVYNWLQTIFNDRSQDEEVKA